MVALVLHWSNIEEVSGTLFADITGEQNDL